jgi:hypothetical protein
MKERPLGRALAWLLFLGPFFFLSYNFANAAAAQRAYVPVLKFSWEQHIPFLAWTILPYWSSDLLYALSLGICRTRSELDLHVKRLLAIQIFCIACFLVFPLRCAMERPAISGWEDGLWRALLSFDQPFNQAPSLHVGFAVILWLRFRANTAGIVRITIAALFVVEALSTLTTYQHQFIDVPTGLWAGLLVVAALPERRKHAPELRLTLLYLAGAIGCTAAAFLLQGLGWLLLWPGFALSMVACAYWSGDSIWLGTESRLLRPFLWPYTATAWLNSRIWTMGQPSRNHLLEGVWIGRAPSRLRSNGTMKSVVGLAPELPIQGDAKVAMLDLMVPTEEQLDAAVYAIMGLSDQRPTLVCCALGYSRSAIAAAAWLIAAGHAAGPQEAIEKVKRARPQVVVKPDFEQRLAQWAARHNGNAS